MEKPVSRYDLSGRCALVTGGARGIGAACCRALAAAGASVYCADVDVTRAAVLCDELKQAGHTVQPVGLDVTDSNSVDAVARQLPTIDILVCNAGVGGNAPAEVLDDAEWDRVMSVNLGGVFRTCRAFGQRMIAVRHGVIVNMGSMSGLIVNRPQPQCHYNASKAGVHQLTKSLAVEWAQYGIRVNAVAPTYILTELLEAVQRTRPEMTEAWIDDTPMRRFGTPEEVAAVVLFLASDASSLITGTVVNVDAGYTAL